MNESLKKKLGIAHIKVPSHPQFSPMAVAAAVTPPLSSSPMMGGSRTPTTPPTTTTKKGTPNRRQSEAAEILSQPTEAITLTNNHSAKKPVRTRGKYAKREPKKAAAAVLQALTSNNNHQSSDLSLMQVPDEFWFKGMQEEDALASLHLHHWYLPEFSDAVPTCPDTPPKLAASPSSAGHCPLPLVLHLSREERLELKRCELRRRTIQLRNAEKHREVIPARRRFLLLQATMRQEGEVDDDVEMAGSESVKLGATCSNFTKQLRVCRNDGCPNETLIFTAFCAEHISGTVDEQLYAPCSVQLADKSQCSRVPEFDMSHELPLCSEHARERRAMKGVNVAGGRANPVVAKTQQQQQKQLVKEKDVSMTRSQRREKSSARTTIPAKLSGARKSTGGGGGVATTTVSVTQKSSAISAKAHTTAAAVVKQHISPAKQRTNNNVLANPVKQQFVTIPVKATEAAVPRTKHLAKVQAQQHRPEMLQRFTKGPSAYHQMSHHPQKVPAHSVVMMMMQDEHDDFVDEDDSVGLGGEEEHEEVDSLLSRNSNSYQVRGVAGVGGGRKRGHGAAGRMGNQTDLLLVSENSSAYESSEDTGVGGLSESEMIGEWELNCFFELDFNVILLLSEEIGFDSQFLEDPEFDNVLEDLLAGKSAKLFTVFAGHNL